ncbi:MAG: hydrogenase expression/formation protein HypE [Actinomycetota bacterium]|nr:hydrogenase expression/formation protein HypE [Actinomycetota bacterium]
MAHGAGMKATQTLVSGLFEPSFANEALAELADAATLNVEGVGIAFTTDSYVVKPLSFPGSSIGELAVNGTLNDLAVSGARPVALSAAFIIEEGLDADILRAEVAAMAAAAERARVPIATGDTKVVERGKADGMYITTAGVGVKDRRSRLSATSIRPGDRILCSGTIGDHGTAVMLARGDLELDADISSDSAPVWELADALMESVGPSLRVMRDPTRGGVATVLNELAHDADVGVILDEDAVPLQPAVKGACEILGIDPMYVANEGKVLAVVAADAADVALAALRRRPLGTAAAIIGEIAEQPEGMVLVRTGFGGTRIMDMLIGDPLPRIC